MPRRRHRGGGSGSGAPLATVFNGEGDGQADRAERIAVFERTKMCKFHILGACTKGGNCRFAHDRTELQALPDLQRTKLCKTLIATGECNNPACRYAHNREEIRPLPSAPFALLMPMPQQDHRQPRVDGFMAAVASDPNMQNPLQQAAFGSAMQAAILQVGQVAQAHAAEAARLQALAAQLQSGGMPASATAPFFSAAAAFGGTALDPKAFAQGFGQDPTYSANPGTHDLLLGLGEAVDGHPAWRSENSDFDYDMPAMAGPSSTQPGTTTSWSSTMSRVLGDEPVQIRPETLRSLSSSSLALLAGTDSEEELGPPKPRQRQLSAVNEDGPGRGYEKRSQDTPWAEDAGGSVEVVQYVEPSSPGAVGRRSAESTADCAAGPALPEAKSFATRGADTAGGRADGGDVAFGGDAEEETRRRSMTASLADTLSATGITIKNTFLDFAPREPAPMLRAVQTAAGRLDLLGQE